MDNVSSLRGSLPHTATLFPNHAPVLGGFDLLETMLWEPVGGFFLLDYHLSRLARSAQVLGFALRPGDAERALSTAIPAGSLHSQRVRLTLARDGSTQIQSAPLDTRPTHLRAAWSAECVLSADVRLLHKTTDRTFYLDARAARPEVDEVLLWNERGEATETTAGNLVVELESRLVTPPLSSGLLPGCFRAFLLDTGHVRERVLTRTDIEGASRLFQINSVRRWSRLELLGSAP